MESSSDILRKKSPQEFQLINNQALKVSRLDDRFRSTLLIEAQASDFNWAEWLSSEKQQWTDLLYEYGALAFRGFDISSIINMETFSSLTLDDIYQSNTEHQPVVDSATVQIPVEYANDLKLLWHNENTFNKEWPQRAIFACATPAQEGGETPLVDSRLMYDNMPESIRNEFQEKGVMYVRKYGEKDYIGLGWKTIFNTEDKSEVERVLTEDDIEYEWIANGGLITRSIRPGVIQHPVTSEWSWINQAQHWHFSCLPEETQSALSTIFEEKDYPRNCYFGDGSPIANEYMKTILDLYAKYEVSLPWQKGDAILVDNVLCAHSRNAYKGDRKILVCFGNLNKF